MTVLLQFAAGLLAAASALPPGRLPVETLKLPPGFEVSLFARVENPRQMALGDKGTVFTGSRTAGKVHALVDRDGDNRVDDVYLVASGLNMPSGIAFRNGDLYVAAVDRILRFDQIEDHLADPPEPVLVSAALPDDQHHGWKYLAFGPDGSLYVPVGVPCNVCLSTDTRHGTILRMDTETGKAVIYARGVRNSVGFEFHPVTGELWFTDNGRDWMGDDLPPDELNHASRPGLHFGFPYLHGRSTPDPDYGDSGSFDTYTPPALELGAHVAPLGMTFYTGNRFPESYRNNIIIAEHGSWNRSNKTGYRVVAVSLDGNRVTGVSPLASGWLDDESQSSWGRPVDVMNYKGGTLLISDDYADAVYYLEYKPGPVK